MPLRLLGVRDELTDRPWRPPARHWPGLPLIGGIDDQAGGTWLAVHPGIPRVACLLNARGQFADPAGRRSRGELPLRAAADGPGVLDELAGDRAALAAYDPFILICATTDAVTVLTWQGAEHAAGACAAAGAPLAVRELATGTHLFTNAGHAYPGGPRRPVGGAEGRPFRREVRGRPPVRRPGARRGGGLGRLAHPRGGRRPRPRPTPPPSSPGANLPDGRVWGSTSVTLSRSPTTPSATTSSPGPGGRDRLADGLVFGGYGLASRCGRLWCFHAQGQDRRPRRSIAAAAAAATMAVPAA